MKKTDDFAANVYIALLHYPIYNKNGDIITTTVKNLNTHDISRAGKTYGIQKYYVVNHLKSQQELVKRMKDYWTGGYGADYNKNRHSAFSILEIADSLSDVVNEIKETNNEEPALIATDAGNFSGSTSYPEMRNIINNSKKPFLLIFGTGWGLTDDLIKSCDYILSPVYGRGKFNHLSVRSAASIILDRLLATSWWNE